MIRDGRVGDVGAKVEIDRPRKPVIAWSIDFQPGLKAEGPTRVTCELEPVGTAVKLTLTQDTPVAKSKVVDVTSQGWPPLFASLKSFLETDERLIESTKWPRGL